MTISCDVRDLEVVGYADVLTSEMLPAVVPPVFRLTTNPERLLVPPYSLAGAFVYGATEIHPTEFSELETRRQVTSLNPVQAQPLFKLWIDQQWNAHYELLSAADRTLGEIAEKAILDAKHALGKGDIDGAEEASRLAICARSSRAEGWAVKAAIERHAGNAAEERLMARFAKNAVGGELFGTLVDYYFGLIPQRKRKLFIAPMSQAALQKRREAA